jgi:hypothetical protein
MPDDRSRAGRPERRDDAVPPSTASNWLAQNGLFRYVVRPVRAYRVVDRYRGDRVGRAADLGEWGGLWTLRTGDVSWPASRRN